MESNFWNEFCKEVSHHLVFISNIKRFQEKVSLKECNRLIGWQLSFLDTRLIRDRAWACQKLYKSFKIQNNRHFGQFHTLPLNPQTIIDQLMSCGHSWIKISSWRPNFVFFCYKMRIWTDYFGIETRKCTHFHSLPQSLQWNLAVSSPKWARNSGRIAISTFSQSFECNQIMNATLSDKSKQKWNLKRHLLNVITFLWSYSFWKR